MQRRLLTLLAAFALLGACASLPAYAPQGAPQASGYSEERIDAGRWRVQYVGDPRASRALVERDLLFRSAELTLTSGYDWFEISNHRTDIDTLVYPPLRRPRAPEPDRPMRVARQGDVAPHGPRPRLQGQSFDRLVAHQIIAMGAGDRPQGAYDAAALRDSLAPAVLGPRGQVYGGS